MCPPQQFMDLIESFVPNFKPARSRTNNPDLLEKSHRSSGEPQAAEPASLRSWNSLQPAASSSALPSNRSKRPLGLASTVLGMYKLS